MDCVRKWNLWFLEPNKSLDQVIALTARLMYWCGCFKLIKCTFVGDKSLSKGQCQELRIIWKKLDHKLI